MLDKFIDAIEPFALGIIVLAGFQLAGWVTFVNPKAVGIATVFCGILLIVRHVYVRVTAK